MFKVIIIISISISIMKTMMKNSLILEEVIRFTILGWHRTLPYNLNSTIMVVRMASVTGLRAKEHTVPHNLLLNQEQEAASLPIATKTVALALPIPTTRARRISTWSKSRLTHDSSVDFSSSH